MLRSSFNFKKFSFHRCFSDNYGILPQSARVVIAGSGAVANSVAYNLTKLGWNDILILEQNFVKSGTSKRSTGLIGLLKPFAMKRVIFESLNMYNELEKMGYDVGLKKSGSINIAQTQDRVIALERRMSYSRVEGLECEYLSPQEIQKLHPYVSTENVRGGVYVPDDCYADATKICDALVDLAKKNGVQYREQCQVQYVLTDNDSNVIGVETDAGIVHCEYFVNAAGMWSHDLGLKCKKPVKVPVSAAEHYYLITQNLNIPPEYNLLPCIRDYDSCNYSRQMNNDLLIGWYEGDGSAAFSGKTVPKNWIKDLEQNAQERLEKIWDKLVERYPILSGAKSAPIVRSSPDAYTVDAKWILGESPEVNKYFVAVGTNGNSIQGAGGMGKYVAEWIVAGRPTQELFSFSIQRFIELHNNRSYLTQRIKEVVAKHYQIQYPNQSEYKYARKLRTSPLYSVLEQKGSVFGTKMAYERALYFDTDYKKGNSLPKMPEPTFFKPKFFNFLLNEYAACCETVGIIDISSFSKIKIKSSNANEVVSYLQKLCCSDADIEVETCIKTAHLNKDGGYENECILVRQNANSFFMISPTSQQTRILEWMTNNLPKNNNSIKLSDHTSSYTVLNVVGPKALALLSELTNTDINLKPFEYRQVNVGFASNVLVLSYTHTGESGFCLLVPSECSIHVYDELMKVGADYGAKDVGTITQRFMRIERFIPFMGEELTSVITPLEAGQDYYVDFNKQEDFLGKQVLLKQKNEGVRKRLVMFLLDEFDVDADIWPFGSEPIFRNNEYVGLITSACYGFTSGKIVCLGFVENTKKDIITPEYIMDDLAKYHIDIANRRFAATPFISRKLPFLIKQDEERAKSASSRYRPQQTVFSIKKRQ
ncbi:hypothetical protein PVAND_002825 [Polypedilum vanderplanki]|uniref:Uncharacterized protein n=1 Tax=Polypedilum vanderplanki TaxID=319348 RepID=A0A9J6BS76_POLVA|nr:hypothetical protein PVAND_002825 [Polypedilum vanderplanki]